jgi:hypothetical protein
VPLFGQRAEACKRNASPHDFCDPKIEDFDDDLAAGAPREDEVCGLDIAMDDAGGVGGLEPETCLGHDFEGQRRWQRAEPVDGALEVFAFEELHHDVGRAGRRVGVGVGDDGGSAWTPSPHSRVEDADDVRGAQRPHRPGLTAETADAAIERDKYRLGGAVVDHFNRHAPPRGGLDPLIDRPHPALAD